MVSDRAHLLLDFHQEVDGLRESELAKSFIGTTKRGIDPCYSSKVIRNDIRIGDLRHMDTFPQKLDVLLSDAASRFSGFKYTPSSPFVTSSSPSAGGICTGLGIAPRVVGDLVGVVNTFNNASYCANLIHNTLFMSGNGYSFLT